MEKLLLELAEKFKDYAGKAMSDADLAAKGRHWVKCAQKETESQTWMEAYRMTKRIIETSPPSAEANKIPTLICEECGTICRTV